VLCQASPLLAQRRGLLADPAPRVPETPFLFPSLRSAAAAAELVRASRSDAHIVTPIAASNLRMLVEREARLRTLARRYRETLHRVREQDREARPR
jgi:hypothetical protein